MENYFNYFTEVEECFRKQRGTPTLLSTLDWALVESWKEAGVPLEAVLIGIDRAFEKFAKKPRRFRKINGLAYCSQEVLEAAEELKAAVNEGGGRRTKIRTDTAPFSPEEVQTYLRRNVAALGEAERGALESGQAAVAGDLSECAAALGKAATDAGALADLQELENFLAALEEKLTASVTRSASVELLAQIRREVERELVPYRQKMTGLQIESLERQFLKKRLYEHYRIPRLSLFYMT